MLVFSSNRNRNLSVNMSIKVYFSLIDLMISLDISSTLKISSTRCSSRPPKHKQPFGPLRVSRQVECKKTYVIVHMHVGYKKIPGTPLLLVPPDIPTMPLDIMKAWYAGCPSSPWGEKSSWLCRSSFEGPGSVTSGKPADFSLPSAAARYHAESHHHAWWWWLRKFSLLARSVDAHHIDSSQQHDWTRAESY